MNHFEVVMSLTRSSFFKKKIDACRIRIVNQRASVEILPIFMKYYFGKCK